MAHYKDILDGYNAGGMATIDKVDDATMKLQNQLTNKFEEINKQVSRLDRFNRKSRWISAGKKRR